ncbi:hypothetical protein RRU01S_25_00610 [Agrobacterium rubi TR3 = NBRC 13261]|uniref:Uncharacterized protein n=1 Tax=Agrobacterium rubi TR3 = NBRC 13261 TaxID=1368415 RepID=A0A081D0C5_9HYPH|nr:hypothetical protein RRU01S_25_00610 [Agrobacterium rubi TR3 = NBRC 13261]
MYFLRSWDEGTSGQLIRQENLGTERSETPVLQGCRLCAHDLDASYRNIRQERYPESDNEQ